MNRKDIPDKTLVCLMSDMLDIGSCYGHVIHRRDRKGDYSESTIKVSPTCSFRFPSTAKIEAVESPSDLEFKFIITL